MPPKAKFTREEIIDCAVKIIEESGTDALTARSLGAELGGSARPIFTVFGGMDEVGDEVNKRINEIYGEYVEAGLKEDLAFKGVGKAYIRFAAERPRLFRILFMSERSDAPDKSTVLKKIEKHYGEILGSIIDAYGITRAAAEELYFHIWVYTHGIAALIATGTCTFTPEEISELLTQAFVALKERITGGEK